MKTEVHPKYQDVSFKCACGAAFTAGSTLSDSTFNTEICSKCHPFYTGKQKLIDTSGRVDKFMEKMKKAQAHAEKGVKKVDNEDAEKAAKETTEQAEEKTTEETTTEAKPKQTKLIDVETVEEEKEEPKEEPKEETKEEAPEAPEKTEEKE